MIFSIQIFFSTYCINDLITGVESSIKSDFMDTLHIMLYIFFETNIQIPKFVFEYSLNIHLSPS